MDWLDFVLEHSIYIEYYASYLADESLDVLLALESEIEEELRKAQSIATKAQLKEWQKYVTEFIDDRFSEIEKSLTESARALAESEADWFSAGALAILGVSLVVPKNIGDRAVLMPITTSNTAKSALDQMRTNLKDTYRTALQRSYFMGDSVEQSLEGAAPRVKSVNNGFKAETQTAVASAARNARNSIVRNNPEVFRSFMWCSILDSNTCLVCGEMHGTVFNRFNAAPFIPVHERCRCELIPYTEDEPPEMEYGSYEEWIEAQDEETQKKVLGKTRFELWRNKEITLDRFVADGRKLTLEDVYREMESR